MEELLKQAELLLNKAMELARKEVDAQVTLLNAEVASLKEAAAKYTTTLDEARKAAYEEGYQQGHGDALASLDLKPSDEEEEEPQVAEPSYEVLEPLVLTAEESDFTTIDKETFDGGVSADKLYAVAI